MTEKYKGKYRGQTFRLQQWDYSSEGLYFITICTHNREHFFGEIISDASFGGENGVMVMNEIGRIVESEWLKTPIIRPDMILKLDEFMVMPDHFYAIIHNGSNQYNQKHFGGGDTMHCVTTTTNNTKSQNQFGPQSKNLAAIIRGFKSSVTTWCRKNNYPNFKWQSLFHDYIIRNQKAFENIRQYIIDNPKNWKK